MDEHRPPHPLAGVWAAALTPLGDSLAPDRERVLAHARWLLANGCDGVLLLGTTGEANSLSVEARRALIDATSALPPERLMIGIGSSALDDAVALGQEALGAGCPNLLALPPFYYKTPSEDGLFAFFAELVARLADPRLRLYLYQIPKMSGVALTPSLIRRLITAFPGTLAGIKDSSGDWVGTAHLIAEFPVLTVFSGTERHLLDNLRAGGPGCISAAANVAAPAIQRLYQAWRTPEAARLLEPAVAARAAMEGLPMIPAMKALLRRKTGDRAWCNLVPPFLPLTAEEERALVARLDVAHFFESVPEMRPAASGPPIAG